MSSSNRRSLISSSSATAMAKRPAAADNSARVSAAAALQKAKKRVALGNLSNHSNGLGRKPDRPVTKTDNVNAVSSISKVKKGQVTSTHATGLHQNSVTTTFNVGLPQTSVTTSFNMNPTIVTSIKGSSFKGNDRPTPTVGTYHAPCSTIVSPSRSEDSVSLDETMSTCDSMESPKFEYIDNRDSSAVASLERQASNNLHISHDEESTGCTWKKNVPVEMEAAGQIIDVDDDESDPQLCATLACDIYNHLRMAEAKKRPSTDFMERVQKDVNESMRAILIDWLVEVTEEYRLVPDTLYLTVNYIDRYLSGNEINRQRLQLLGVACMMIAAKYEEICAPQVEEFCYITDNTYFKDEVLQMETDVLNYLKFEMTAPTTKCFLRRFVRVAQGCDEAPLLQLEFLANYVAELSLLEYDMLCYSPSLIAAASVFLARFILKPTKQPWNHTLSHYTLYKPSELCNCTKAMHQLLCNNPGSSLPAIREKYSQHKYKFVAKKNCPSSIPSQFFEDSSS